MGHIFLTDVKRMIREPFLMLMMIVPIIAGVALRLIIPLIDPYLPIIELMSFDYVLTPFIILFVGMMYGAVVGFLLLDERDEHTLIAMFVTPYGRLGYFLLKVVMVCVVTFVYGIILSMILSFTLPRFSVILALAFIVAIEAPIGALVMVNLAKNKVEGLAIMKLYSVLVLMPALKYILPLNFEWAFVFVPYYWPIKIFEIGHLGGNLMFTLLCGTVVHAAYLLLLLKQFEKQVI